MNPQQKRELTNVVMAMKEGKTLNQLSINLEQYPARVSNALQIAEYLSSYDDDTLLLGLGTLSDVRFITGILVECAVTSVCRDKRTQRASGTILALLATLVELPQQENFPKHRNSSHQRKLEVLMSQFKDIMEDYD